MIDKYIYINDTVEAFIFYECFNKEFCESNSKHYLAIDKDMRLWVIYLSNDYMWTPCPNIKADKY